MRVVQAVNSLFTDAAFIRKANFASRLKGGWERWFQMELAYAIAKEHSVTCSVSLENESVYPGAAFRADMVLQSAIGLDTTTVVELKCQTLQGDTEDFYQLIESDIQKIGALASGTDYQVIALVRDRADIEPLYHALANSHPDQVNRYTFPSTLTFPSGFISFYQGAGSAV